MASYETLVNNSKQLLPGNPSSAIQLLIDLGYLNAEQVEQSWLNSDNEGYPGTADHMASYSETNPSSSDTDPSSPETDQSSPETNPSSPETDPSSPETDPSSPETDPSSPETDPSSPETDPSSPETDPSSPETDPSSPETNPSSPETNPSSPETDPSSPETDPSSPETDPSSPETDPSSPETDPSSPEMPVSVVPITETDWFLYCPLPQTQLKESRILSYLKTVRERDTQNVDAGNGQSDLVQKVGAIRKPWPLVEREWIDERDRDIATLSTKVQNLELVADMWKDQYDSLTHAHNLEALEMKFQARRLTEQLQEERLRSHNRQMLLKLENMFMEARLKTHAYGDQLPSINNVYPQAAQMYAPVTTSGYPEAASGFGPQVQMTGLEMWAHVSEQLYGSY